MPETGSAALYAGCTTGIAVLFPACEAVMVQAPVPVRVTVVDDTPEVRVEDPAEHGPVATKLTSWLFGEPFESAVAVTPSVGVEMATELGNGPSWIV